MPDGFDEAVQIVPISEEHIPGFHECLDSVAKERKYLRFVEAPPPDAARAFILSNIKNSAPQFVALMHEQVIGWCDFIPDEFDGFRPGGNLRMGVLSGFRGRGIRERLIRKTVDRVIEIGLLRIELGIFASNLAPVKLYEKVGFVVECRKLTPERSMASTTISYSWC